MMPGGPFEPFVEPIPGQFDAADGAWSVGKDGTSDFFSVDTGAVGIAESPTKYTMTDVGYSNGFQHALRGDA